MFIHKADGYKTIVNTCLSYQVVIFYHVILGKILKIAKKINIQVNSSLRTETLNLKPFQQTENC